MVINLSYYGFKNIHSDVLEAISFTRKVSCFNKPDRKTFKGQYRVCAVTLLKDGEISLCQGVISSVYRKNNICGPPTHARLLSASEAIFFFLKAVERVHFGAEKIWNGFLSLHALA